jgi:ABC-type oligopeptide transport system ATPase subunit
VLLQAVDLTVSYARPRRVRRQSAGTRASGGGTPLALNNVSLTIARGSLLGILGPNGSGKTTLLRLLAGTLMPDAGQVLLDGTDVRRIARSAMAKRFAVVPQETQLAFEYTALEIALMGRYPHLSAFEIEGPRGPIQVYCAHLSWRDDHSAIRQAQVTEICRSRQNYLPRNFSKPFGRPATTTHRKLSARQLY